MLRFGSYDFFSGERSFRGGDKYGCVRAVAGVVPLAWKCSRSAPALALMVPSDFFSLMMLRYAVFNGLKDIVTVCALECLHSKDVLCFVTYYRQTAMKWLRYGSSLRQLRT